MDRLTPQKRSRLMSKIKSINTTPEKAVRHLLTMMGFRYRLHYKTLPGKPDIVFPARKKVVFIHGCFWHSHPGCHRSARPVANRDFWDKKLDNNIVRDRKVLDDLAKLGWDALTVWGCQLKDGQKLRERLDKYLNNIAEESRQ